MGHNGQMNIIDMPDEPSWPKRQQTALEKLHEEMQRQLAPFRQWEQMQDLIKRSSPLYQMEELLKRTSPGRQFEEILARSTLPKHVQDLLDKSSAPAQAQRMLEQYLPQVQLGLNDDVLRSAAGFDAVAKTVSAWERNLAPLTQQQEWLEKLQRQALGGLSVQNLARHLEYAKPAMTAFEAARKSLENMSGAFQDIDFSEIELDDEEQSEAEQVAQTITQAATAEPTLQAAVDQIIAAIESQQNPSLRLMLWLFFRKMMDWIIAGIISAVISQYMPQIAPRSPQEATKSVKEVARSAFDSPVLLTEYRFVSVKVLVVRQNPKARAPQLGKLGFGTAVKLLKKDKDFALVLWTDKESGCSLAILKSLTEAAQVQSCSWRLSLPSIKL